MKYNYKKRRKKITALILLLVITIGYALLSTTLKINGIAGIKSNTWNIHWDDTSIEVNSGSVSASTPVVSTTTSTKDTVSFDVELELPGDYFEFEIDAINEGSVDAALELAQNWITYKSNGETTTLPSYMNFSVVYADNTTPETGDVLKATRSKTYKIRVEFKSNVEELPSNPQPITIEVELPYKQYNDPTPQPRTCEQFEDDSWDTIKRNVSLKEDTYPVGCEKDIDLGTYGIHTVRVANNTTPTSCENESFSQSACGFVVEFKDVITNHRINPYDSGDKDGDGSYGGWEHSEIRTLVNNNIYNALPQELKDKIIYTPVVSGHGMHESNNFNTIDKLYLFSPKEIWEKVEESDIDSYDSAWNSTRQLDYYHNRGVTETTFSGAIKKLNGEADWWWLRSPKSTDDLYFYYVNFNGSWYLHLSTNENGVSPAFRIGKDWVLTNSPSQLKDQKWEYYYNNKKKLQNGWYKLKDFSGNDQYYFFENGFMKLGWYKDSNNHIYYLSEKDADENGYVDGNRVYGGVFNIDGTDYTFDNDGICTNNCPNI